MKILFFEKYINAASHRIFMDNLREWLSELNYDVTKCANISDDFCQYDIIICGKSTKKENIEYIRTLIHKNAIIGLADTYSDLLKLCDFGIMGCVSQWNIAVTYNPNSFIFPYIEKHFTKTKKHLDSEKIIIGYHGNKDHLEEMSDAYRLGLEEVAKEYNIKLHAIYSKSVLGKWTQNRPNIEIEEIEWDFKTWEDELLKIDIGITPNTIPFFPKNKNKLYNFFFSKMKLKAKSLDWILRYKGTVNASRSFVFHQLGIPVISEMFPGADSIIAEHDCGFIAQTQEAVVLTLKKLISDYEYRKIVSENARLEFNRRYDPIIWTKKLINDISAVYMEKITK